MSFLCSHTNHVLLFSHLFNSERLIDRLIIHKPIGLRASGLSHHVSCERTDWATWWLTFPGRARIICLQERGQLASKCHGAGCPDNGPNAGLLSPVSAGIGLPFEGVHSSCIRATLRSIIRWACQFPTRRYRDAINTVHHAGFLFAFMPSIRPSAVLAGGNALCQMSSAVFNQKWTQQSRRQPNDGTLAVRHCVCKIRRITRASSLMFIFAALSDLTVSLFF